MELEGLLNGKDLTKIIYCEKYLPSKGQKEFCPNNSWLEKKQIENQLEDDFNFIKANNIERENNISHAHWISHLKKAKVTKKVGKCWESLGHHQENEEWLLPEEALFLVENCELLLFVDDVPVSVEDCYKLIINEGCISWDEFRVFSHLSRAGFIVVRHSQSVSVTRYEQQVGLDAIIQNQKRSPPETSSDDVTIVEDDDILIIEATSSTKTLINKPLRNASSSKKTLNILNNESENIIIIESDDEVKEVNSDSDSDVICISSPFYNTDKNSREWYPSLTKALKITAEKIIDLCNEEKFNGCKYNIRNLIDLIRPSKAEILAHVPSVVHNDNNYKFKPDQRLLPLNVVPKYSEYSFNLHITSDDADSNGYTERRIPFGPPVNQTEMDFLAPRNFNNFGMNQMIQNNPLLMKAQQMQAMAMNMMQSAQALMSVMTTAMQNPNELWQVMRNPLPSISSFGTPRFGPPNNEFRPFNSFPRRTRPFSGRFPRRFPYDRRPWYGRRQFTPQRSIAEKPAFSNTSYDVVILSDEEDEADDKRNIIKQNQLELVSTRKRKMNAVLEQSKCVKLEGDIDSTSTSLSGISICLAESTCENVKKEPTDFLSNENIKKEPDAKIKSELRESEGSSESREYAGAFESPVECFSKIPVKQEKNQVPSPVTLGDRNNLIKNEDVDLLTSNRNLEDKKSSQEPEVNDVLNSPSNFNRVLSSVNTETLLPTNCSSSSPVLLTMEPKITPGSSKVESDETEYSQAIIEVKDSEIYEKSSGLARNWKHFKNDFDDSSMNFDQCVSFGDILSRLKIFKPIEVSKVNKKLKISYDMYLQEGRFKKSFKVLPDFRIIILKPTDNLPTSVDIAGLKKQYQDNICFLFSIVFDDTIGFYLYDSITLTTLL